MKYKQLTLEQRYQLSALLKSQMSQRCIATALGVHESTISRELKRNRGKRGYRPKQANDFALTRRYHSAKAVKWTPSLQSQVVSKLKQQWSPEQIANVLLCQGDHCISHERIYQFIWADKQEGGQLYRRLRCSHRKHRRRYGSHDHRGKIAHRVGIEKRPKIVDKRVRIGDWEIDTLIGKRHQGAIVSIVERKSLFTLLAKVSAKQAKKVSRQTIKLLTPYQSLVHTVTGDNGQEFSDHQTIAKALSAQFYFADPYCSWQRGTNENTNGLVRQYLPKQTNFKKISKQKVQRVMDKLNNRPRKSLNYQTPNQVFQQALAQTL